MTRPFLISTFAIALSGSVSSAQVVANATDAMLLVPNLTSCQLAVQVASDPSSASFQPAFDSRSLGAAFSWPIGSGSGAMSVYDLIRGGQSMRLVTSVPQAAVRTFTLMTRSR